MLTCYFMSYLSTLNGSFDAPLVMISCCSYLFLWIPKIKLNHEIVPSIIVTICSFCEFLLVSIIEVMHVYRLKYLQDISRTMYVD